MFDIVIESFDISKYGNFDLPYRIGRVLPSIPWRPRVFCAGTQRNLRCTKYGNRVISITLVFLFVGLASNSVIVLHPTLFNCVVHTLSQKCEPSVGQYPVFLWEVRYWRYHVCSETAVELLDWPPIYSKGSILRPKEALTSPERPIY